MHCHTTVLFTIVAVMNHPGVTHSYRLFAPVFFFNDPAPTEIYTLSLHDALPITAGRNASTSASTAASGRSERSQTSSSTPRARRPRATRATVTALPRTEGNANGESSATRGDIGPEHTGIGASRPDAARQNCQVRNPCPRADPHI